MMEILVMKKKGLSALFQPVELTQGECWKTILAFSFPIIVSYLLQQVYTISDAAIVGQTLTAQEVAGVNDTSSLIFIFLQFAFGVSAGFCVVTSCNVGAHNPAGVRRSLTTQIVLSAALTVILTVLGGLVLRERVRKKALFCAVLCSLGILLLIDPSGAVDPLGVALALTSGVTYAVYILLLAHFRHREVMGFRMTFYMALISAVCMFFLCLFSHQLCLPQTLAGWLAALAFSLMICIGAVMLFQKGTFLIGAQRAAILSTFEPITSIFVGILFLNETLTPRILLGSAITLVAGVFITLGGKKDEDKEEAAKD
jgi:drug/metabolite transporter (DMT)-like permease